MKRITLNGVKTINEQEHKTIQALFDAHSENLHYLAFARQLYGFSPLGTWLEKNEELRKQSDNIINVLLEKKEVCSLYPKEKLTLYPIIMNDSKTEYYFDLTNNDKNFADIIELNDNVYKTEYLVVDFDHIENIKKQDFEQIISSLQYSLTKSKKLKGVYLIDGYHVV